jgi:type VI secretion system secreted protein Hcp
MTEKALGRLLSKTALLILAGIMTLALATSCAGTASPTPGEASPTASVAASIPGAGAFAPPPLEQDMGTGYEMFLSITGIEGESTDEAHKDWIDVLSYSHRVSQSATAATSGGARSGQSQHEDFTITKPLDKSSPKLVLYCCNGARIPEVTFEVCRSSGDKQEFMVYTLTDAIVSAVSVSGSADSGDARPVEEVSFNYSKIEWKYTETDATTGKPKGNVEAGWDVTGNKSI